MGGSLVGWLFEPNKFCLALEKELLDICGCIGGNSLTHRAPNWHPKVYFMIRSTTFKKKKEKYSGPRRTCSFYREHWLVVQMISFPRYLTFLSPRVVLLGLMEKHPVPSASSVRWELVADNKCCVSSCSAAPAFFLTFSAMIWLSLYSSYWEKNLWKCMLTNVVGKNVGLIVFPFFFGKEIL